MCIVSENDANLGNYGVGDDMSPGAIVQHILLSEELLSFAKTRKLSPGAFRVEIKRRRDEDGASNYDTVQQFDDDLDMEL